MYTLSDILISIYRFTAFWQTKLEINIENVMLYNIVFLFFLGKLLNFVIGIIYQ